MHIYTFIKNYYVTGKTFDHYFITDTANNKQTSKENTFLADGVVTAFTSRAPGNANQPNLDPLVTCPSSSEHGRERASGQVEQSQGGF